MKDSFDVAESVVGWIFKLAIIVLAFHESDKLIDALWSINGELARHTRLAFPEKPAPPKWPDDYCVTYSLNDPPKYSPCGCLR